MITLNRKRNSDSVGLPHSYFTFKKKHHNRVAYSRRPINTALHYHALLTVCEEKASKSSKYRHVSDDKLNSSCIRTFIPVS